jgi:hypothetical protein
MNMHSDTQIQYHAPWHDLQWVCVGAAYSPDFFQPVKNTAVRQALQKIAAETCEDFDNLITVLESLGVKVSQVKIDSSATIMDYVDHQGRLDYSHSQSFNLIPRPPMQPRDSVLIVGHQVLLTNNESKWFTDLCPNYPTVRSQIDFDAPLVTVVGDRLIADCRDHSNLAQFLQQRFDKHVVVPVLIGGHNDAVFSIVKPGVIVSTYHHTNYRDTFPGWEVKFIENQSWNAVSAWRTLKHSNKIKWWVPDSYHSEEFAHFVDTWLNNWVGYVAETVFDVNMLQINDRCVLVNNYNRELFEFLQQHRIEPIVVPFRHRFFWDGGLHCVTNDLYREGKNDCYF